MELDVQPIVDAIESLKGMVFCLSVLTLAVIICAAFIITEAINRKK